MLTRTNTTIDLLNEAIKHGLLDCQSCDNGAWTPVTDRSVLYAALINALIDEANGEGLAVLDSNGGNLFDERPIESVYCNAQDDYD